MPDDPKPPESLSDIVSQISMALRDGIDRAISEHRAGYTDPHEVAELRRELDALLATNNELAERLKDHGRMPEQLRIAQETLRRRTDDLSSLTEERDRWMAEAEELVRQRDATWERKERLEDEVGKLLGERGALQASNAQLKTNNAEAARNLSVAFERIETLERDLHHETTVADRANDFLREKDIEISELKALVETLGKDLEARKGSPRIDVFDKLEWLRTKIEEHADVIERLQRHDHTKESAYQGVTGGPRLG